jgi:hypothetical protein
LSNNVDSDNDVTSSYQKTRPGFQCGSNHGKDVAKHSRTTGFRPSQSSSDIRDLDVTGCLPTAGQPWQTSGFIPNLGQSDVFR